MNEPQNIILDLKKKPHIRVPIFGDCLCEALV